MKELHPRYSYTNFEDAIFCTSKVIANVKVVGTDKQTGQKQYAPGSARDGGIKRTRKSSYVQFKIK